MGRKRPGDRRKEANKVRDRETDRQRWNSREKASERMKRTIERRAGGQTFV